MFRRLVLIFAAFSLSYVGFAPAEAAAKCGDTGKVIGGAIGGAAGILFGRKIDGGKNRTVGTLVGGALGIYLGSKLGKALDKCDQEKFANATQTALDNKGSGKQDWSSDTNPNVKGTVVASAPQQTEDGRVCRSVTRVNYIDGQEMQDNPRFCRKPPSTSWAPA